MKIKRKGFLSARVRKIQKYPLNQKESNDNKINKKK